MLHNSKKRWSIPFFIWCDPREQVSSFTSQLVPSHIIAAIFLNYKHLPSSNQFSLFPPSLAFFMFSLVVLSFSDQLFYIVGSASLRTSSSLLTRFHTITLHLPLPTNPTSHSVPACSSILSSYPSAFPTHHSHHNLCQSFSKEKRMREWMTNDNEKNSNVSCSEFSSCVRVRLL